MIKNVLKKQYIDFDYQYYEKKHLGIKFGPSRGEKNRDVKKINIFVSKSLYLCVKRRGFQVEVFENVKFLGHK